MDATSAWPRHDRPVIGAAAVVGVRVVVVAAAEVRVVVAAAEAVAVVGAQDPATMIDSFLSGG
jgi:Na+-transporting methylmalonyl-CoA/oxaloacetate decarboxylase beta subunit